MFILSFILNAVKNSQVRREERDGVMYLVVNGVAIIEGVLNGYLVPMEEFGAFVQDWNGVDVSINHPEGNGGSLRVPHPDVNVVGRFYNAVIDEEHKRLIGEFWLNEAALNASDEGRVILSAIENNKTLEVSTGYFASAEMKPGRLGNKVYVGIHRNIHPDHIALLPNDVGACSVDAGCGLNRNIQNESFTVHNCNTCERAHNPKQGVSNMNWAQILEAIQNALKAGKKRFSLFAVKNKEGAEGVEIVVHDDEPAATSGSNTQGQQAAGNFTLPESLVQLSDWMQHNGGFAALKELLEGSKGALAFANSELGKIKAKKDALVARMAKNAMIGLNEAELQKMSIEGLEVLDSRFAAFTNANAEEVVDFSGAGLFQNEAVSAEDAEKYKDLPVPSYSTARKPKAAASASVN